MLSVFDITKCEGNITLALPCRQAPIHIGSEISKRKMGTGRYGGKIPQNVPDLLNDRIFISKICDRISLFLFDFAQQAAGFSKEAKQGKCKSFIETSPLVCALCRSLIL